MQDNRFRIGTRVHTVEGNIGRVYREIAPYFYTVIFLNGDTDDYMYFNLTPLGANDELDE